MKKILKRIMTMGLIAILSLVIISCEKKSEITPEESLNIYMGILISENKEGIEKIGLSDAEFFSIISLRNEGFKMGVASDPAIKKSLDDKLTEDLLTSVTTAMKKVEFNAVSSEINGDNAIVNVEVRGLDFEKIMDDTIEDMTKDITKYSGMSEDEINREVMKTFIIYIGKAEIKNEKKTVIINMKKDKKGEWQIEKEEVETLIKSIME
ncbi:DUF5105 domain-containing protein [Clostridium paraputrificum]|uniref:DUF5105 domain-containing protein n=1 Tax=Clostridium paraputrificum TaxID=29363 RepID=UPI003D33F981